MGIRGFYSLMNSIPGSYRVVNIVEELRKFKNERGKDPVIIINLWTLSNHFKVNLRDKLFGGRLNEIKAEFENFLITLRDNGAKLIFVFKRNQNKEWDFVASAEEDYKSGCEILDVIATIKKTEDVVKHFERNPRYLYPYNQSLLMVFAQTASQYGELRGMDSDDSKASTVHAHLASKFEAMALMGLDTYYMFYEGSWKVWSDKDFDIKTMTIREYNKEVILRHLELNFEKAPLFVALSGGLYTSEENIKIIGKFFKSWTWNFLTNAAEFVNRQRFPVTDDVLSSIVREIFGRNDPEIVAEFRHTLNLMTQNIESSGSSKFDKNLMEISENEYMNHAYQILTDKVIYISPVFTDLRCNDMKPVYVLVAPWIQRTAGILLKHQNDAAPRTLLVKTDHKKKLFEKKIDPIVPNFEVPSLHDLITGKLSTAMSRKLLMWVCDCENITDELDAVPDEQLCNIIILLHCIKQQSMKDHEAKMILQTIIDVGNGNVPNNIEYPTNMDERALRVCLLFSKLFYTLHSCLSSIGLKRYQTDYQFDNVYYQKILMEAQNKEARVKDEVKGLDDCMEIFSTLITITK